MNQNVSNGFAWCSLIAGTVSLVVGVIILRSAKQQRDWMTVSGTVVSSEVKFDGELYFPAVTYRYEIADQQLVRDTVRTGLVCFNWRGPAQRICARYAVNAQIRVYVDPQDPSNSVLEPGGDRRFLSLICAVSALLVAAGLAVLL